MSNFDSSASVINNSASVIDMAKNAYDIALDEYNRCLQYYSFIGNSHTSILCSDDGNYKCMDTINTVYHFAIEVHKIAESTVTITKSALERESMDDIHDNSVHKIVEAALITAKATQEIVKALEVSVDEALTILSTEYNYKHRYDNID
jgi:hypothetical protein